MSTVEAKAMKAGGTYADDQIGSDLYRDWFQDQLIEGDKLSRRGEAARGLETENLIHRASALELAKRMLQQLLWDIDRGIESDEIRQYLMRAGISDTTVDKKWVVLRPLFGQGLRDRLTKNNSARAWLADEIQYWANEHKERSGRSGDMKLGIAGRRPHGAGRRHGNAPALVRRFRVGSVVRMNDDALSNYGEKYRGKKLRVSHVSTKHMPATEFFSKCQPAGYSPGFDASSGSALYDFDGLPMALYDWELESA